jgi:hypothetical protein
MSWGFESGRVYNRRSDIHARFGGQQQGGIITPADHPLVIIITGEEGLQHGYADRYRPDGVFEYFGEGQVGKMQLQRGNRAIAEHSILGKSPLIISSKKARLLMRTSVSSMSYALFTAIGCRRRRRFLRHRSRPGRFTEDHEALHCRR